MSAILLKIFAAGVVSALIGFVWYHPRVFGGAWMRLSGITPESVEKGQRRIHINVLAAVTASMLAAYTMNYLFSFAAIYEIHRAVLFACILWIGFVAPAFLGVVLWDQKPVALYLINSLYWLVSLAAMSVIIVL